MTGLVISTLSFLCPKKNHLFFLDLKIYATSTWHDLFKWTPPGSFISKGGEAGLSLSYSTFQFAQTCVCVCRLRCRSEVDLLAATRRRGELWPIQTISRCDWFFPVVIMIRHSQRVNDPIFWPFFFFKTAFYPPEKFSDPPWEKCVGSCARRLTTFLSDRTHYCLLIQSQKNGRCPGELKESIRLRPLLLASSTSWSWGCTDTLGSCSNIRAGRRVWGFCRAACNSYTKKRRG